MSTLTETVEEFGRKIAQAEARNNTAIAKVADQVNVLTTVRAERVAEALKRLQDATKEVIAATIDLESIEEEGQVEATKIAGGLLHIRKVNEPRPRLKAAE